ncbi:NACHT, LRR and PYD domains-containing protein 14 [Holothuria leucospilota]|uniref:NACHT, LRR and PYD domains-containing protein 14 n=1 Tax=Holothuria leucospilota TaxID=206669 RepID=A0A9Q1C668_HOLLE|nr:NACHT, LRR and PYD domains-containing protein 14 [Holothuria leucospilota]
MSEDEEFPDNVYISRTMSFKLENKISTYRSQPGCLKSFEDILTENEFEQKHFLLEGAAGQGKTFIAMQIVKDWLKPSKVSPLQKFDILIFLSLREMNKKTIFEHVVETLLADDTDLTPNDIEEILMKEKQYLIVLDEFEQYSERHEKDSLVHNVMRHKILRDTRVILMTRPTIYTKTLGRNVVFLSLNNFTPGQIEQYIHCIYERKEDIGKKVTHLLQENVEVAHLCKTPLFLFMTSYLIYKQPSLVDRFRDVTSFLEYFIDSLLTSFLTNPFENHTDEAQIEEKYPRNLTKIAIKGLANLQHSWSKQYLVEQSCIKDVNNLVDIKIFIESEKTAQSGREDAERHQIRFSHEIFQYFYGAIYLAFYASFDEFESFVERLNKHNCQILFIFTCGLSKKSEHVKTIVKLLLKEKDYHPFPIRDCIVQCLTHAKSITLEGMKDELTALCSKEHGMRMLDVEDKALKNAKAKIINVCHNLKVPVNVIALNKVLAGADDDTMRLDCGASFELPDDVKAYFITDFNGHFTDKHCMRLIERTKNIMEVIIFSSLAPSFCTIEALDKIADTEMTVLWVTYKGDHVVSVSFTSKYLCKWVRYSAIVAINHLRQFKGWKSLPPEVKQSKEKEIVSEIEKKGLQTFFNSSQHFSEEERNIMLSRIDDDLKIIQSIIAGWFGTFEAHSEEVAAERRRYYKKHLSKIRRRIFTQMTATSLDELTNDSESDDTYEDEDDDDQLEEGEQTMREFSVSLKLLMVVMQL